MASRPKRPQLHHEDEGNMDLRNVGILPQHYTSSQRRKPRLHPEDGGSMDPRIVGILPQHSMASKLRRPRPEIFRRPLTMLIGMNFIKISLHSTGEIEGTLHIYFIRCVRGILTAL